MLCGWCIDEDMVYINMPFMICNEALEEMMALLSPQTKGVLDGLNEKLFGRDMPQGLLIV